MYIAIIILIVVLSILLTLFVLVQNSKGGGLSAGFSSSNQIMGVRKTTDFVEKMTWGLVIGVVLLSIISVGVHKHQAVSAANDSEIKEQVQQAKQSEPGVVTPDFGEKTEAAKTQAKPTAAPEKK
ncbi:protein translocase subunit secG [Paludibacter propionicigenes WB4]|uniref:Protein-export membrane protein SecG n=1 Tax=Paludibacter propionicigenes (strain DSM 17365 / JCM 13257 / WB4) TaxID=694427 RepID=E4T3N2_PALPW|nr:preprotein translocase subunit SecG [Paludibacter propionicigenes]ADQ79326.1 protein translocase subunit secG [Paludibacter propionicigenes WB4]